MVNYFMYFLRLQTDITSPLHVTEVAECKWNRLCGHLSSCVDYPGLSFAVIAALSGIASHYEFLRPQLVPDELKRVFRAIIPLYHKLRGISSFAVPDAVFHGGVIVSQTRFALAMDFQNEVRGVPQHILFHMSARS